MNDAYVGEIRLAGFGQVPDGWLQCNGQLLSTTQYAALFSILGNIYGGDGQTTFALPDLRGRVPVHFSDNFPIGTSGGEETHTLTVSEIPAHTHKAVANPGTSVQTSPVGGFWSVPKSSSPSPGANYAYASPSTLVPLGTSAIATPSNSGIPHENRSPFLVINFMICIDGIYPSRN